MGEKIFGEIQKTEELNELANNLRKSKEFDEIRLLCSENGISAETAEKFIKGDILLLAEMGHLENSKALQSPTWRAVRTAIKEFQGVCTGKTDPVTERIRKGLLISTEPDKAPDPARENLVYTVADVKKKLEAELEIYRDGDSKYVIEKLIGLCGTDKDLLNAVMLPHKSYDKAFQYFYERSRTVGYKMPHGNMVYLDNDRAVELSVEYFKKDDAADAKRRAEKKKEQPKPQSKPKPQPQKKPDVKPQKREPEKVKPKEVKQVELEIDKAKLEPKAKKNEMTGQLSLFDI